MSHNKNPTTQTPDELPPKPVEPKPYECCGRGCDPCIFDYYAKSLQRWENRVAALKKKQKTDDTEK